MQYPSEVKVGVVSLTTTSDVESNITNAEKLVRQAAADGAGWVVLPEMLGFMGPYDQHHGKGVSDKDLTNRKNENASKILPRLAHLAESLGIILFAGTLSEQPQVGVKGLWQGKEVQKVFNTLYIFGRDGNVLSKYQKIHLFNLMDPSGQPLYCESDVFLPGNELVTLDVEGFKLGLAICYDLRFPELFRKLVESSPVDAFIMPSAFTLQTGADHWELLIRARAVENQCYFVAPNQTGTHSPGKQSYGHSMIVDPWGHKLCDTGDSVGVAFAKLSKTRIKEVRSRLPALNNRRQDITESERR